MKVGIITFHSVANYGAVLQAYALQKAIFDMEHSCELIDYRNEKFEQIYGRISVRKAKSVRQFLSAVVYGKIRNRKLEGFKYFVKKYCVLSKHSYDKYSVKECSGQYDVVVTGSDQVWNLSLTGNDFNYFLDFVQPPTLKCSYAASIASRDYNSEDTGKIRKLLEDYGMVSVREKSAKTYLETIGIHKDISVVLDPTLLLSCDEWRKIGNSAKNIPAMRRYGLYMLVYFVSPTEYNYQAALELANKLSMTPVLINYSHRKIPGFKNLRTVSPEQFVWLIDNAGFVMTNSFHGTVFSINLNKKFEYMLNRESPEKNERIDMITEALKLQDRNYECCNSFKDIDWGCVNRLLEELRTNSLDYLEHSLNGK